jgi:hypothetical protein
MTGWTVPSRPLKTPPPGRCDFLTGRALPTASKRNWIPIGEPMTDDEINQVLRNYDLSQVDQVLAAIKKCLAVQNELIEDQKGRIKVLKEEVEWAVNGYVRRP